jgi:hypothetical protein
MGGSLRLSSLQTLILVLVVVVAIANIGNLANTNKELLDAAKAKSIFKVPRANNSKVIQKRMPLKKIQIQSRQLVLEAIQMSTVWCSCIC